MSALYRKGRSTMLTQRPLSVRRLAARFRVAMPARARRKLAFQTQKVAKSVTVGIACSLMGDCFVSFHTLTFPEIEKDAKETLISTLFHYIVFYFLL